MASAAASGRGAGRLYEPTHVDFVFSPRQETPASCLPTGLDCTSEWHQRRAGGKWGTEGSPVLHRTTPLGLGCENPRENLQQRRGRERAACWKETEALAG